MQSLTFISVIRKGWTMTAFDVRARSVITLIVLWSATPLRAQTTGIGAAGAVAVAPDDEEQHALLSRRDAFEVEQIVGQPAGPPRSYPPSSPSRLARKIAPLPCQAIAPTVSFSIPARVSGPEVRGI